MKAMIAFLIACTAWCLAGEGKAATAAPEELRKIPDLELWVSADDLSGGEGATVAKWPDRTAHHWDLASAGGKHTLALRAINGRPAVWFDGSQNGKNAGPFGAMLTDAKFFDASWKGAMSIFLVARQDIDPGPSTTRWRSGRRTPRRQATQSRACFGITAISSGPACTMPRAPGICSAATRWT